LAVALKGLLYLYNKYRVVTVQYWHIAIISAVLLYNDKDIGVCYFKDLFLAQCTIIWLPAIINKPQYRCIDMAWLCMYQY